MNPRQKLENLAEISLWTVRFLVIVPVFFGVISVLGLFILGSLEIISGLSGYFHFSNEETAQSILTGIIRVLEMPNQLAIKTRHPFLKSQESNS
jgi:uncharacterized membrane protein YqhA